MNQVFDFFLQFLSQFAGGPGPMENNLVRFSLSATLWGALLIVAWVRQRRHDLPREKLLVWGFGLGFASALLMTIFVSLQMLDIIEREATYAILIPLDRALAMSSLVVVAGAFLRYILDDALLAQRYLTAGLATTAICLVIAFWQWPSYPANFAGVSFCTTWGAWLFHVSSSILVLAAIVLLRSKRGWLSNVVSIALMLFLIRELLLLTSYATGRDYSHVFCPIGNSLGILAIPLLGYVYLREQTIEKRQAEKALEAYRHQLEELVEERTSQLQHEIVERTQAEAALEERQRIAADMHDGLAQTVSLLGLRVDEVLALMADGAGREALEELADVRQTVDQVSLDIRRSIASLHESPRRRRSLLYLLSDLLDRLPREDGPAIDLVCRIQQPLFLPLEQGDQALPVVQEALLNARRHAQAQHITLLLERRGQEVILTVEDDGRGFEPAAWWKNSQHHFGLSVMYARAARIGGRLQIDSAPGQGTRVVLSLPLDDPERSWFSATQQEAASQTTAT